MDFADGAQDVGDPDAAASAMSSAVWMTGPSSTGSLCGRPTSTMSAPASKSPVSAAMPPSTVGKPAGR